ncbi:unnamed protein product [Clonostachys solani]|uniref:Zn(2)-C6 fungal-type domain-containing protein n=1 Tax=Clonostachys solani TaxID=160281 RepID=A0A9N9VW30_9HYPO|nr:unnamed protein product [Clonostachys solani]
MTPPSDNRNLDNAYDPSASSESSPITSAQSSRRTSIQEKRRTNGRACITCHQRKIRCDILTKGVPCTNCSSQGRPGCCPYQKKPKQQSSLNTLQSSRSPVPIRPRGRPPKRTPVTLALRPEAYISPESVASPDYVANIARPPSKSPSRGSQQTWEGDEVNESGNLADFISQEDFRASEISYRGRMCFLGSEISNFNYLIRQGSQQPSLDHVLHMRNRQFHKKYTVLDIKSIPAEAFKRPDKKLADELLEAFFVHVNRGWPIVDEHDFMAHYNGNVTASSVPLPLMNALFLVGAHVLAPQRPELRALQSVYFRRAKTLIDARFDQDRTVYIQTALLMTWYSDGMEEIVANAWHWIGIAARTALGVGMHRDASASRMLEVHKRTYVRLWWVLFQFDTMVSAAYGRPQALCLDESDMPFLEASHFEGIPNAEIDFITRHTQLCIIISRTMKKRWALRISDAERIEATREGDRALAQFITHLPRSLRLPVHESEIWKSTLHLTYNNFLLLLHRPPPRQSLGDKAAEACTDLNICSDATAGMTSILETLNAKNGLSSLWLYGLHGVFTCMTQVSTEMASESPLVAAKAQRMFESLSASLRELACQWQFAKALVRLFEERETKIRQQPPKLAGTSMAPQPPDVSVGGDVHADGNGFSLRPHPLSQVTTAPVLVHGAAPDSMAPALPHAGQALGPYEGFSGGSSVHVGSDFGDIFMGDFPFQDAPALEALLAGMDGSDFISGLES